MCNLVSLCWFNLYIVQPCNHVTEPNQLVINVVPLAQPSQPTANQPTANQSTAEEVKAAKDYMIKRYAKNGVLCTISEPEIKKVLETDKVFKNHWEVLMED